ncbi:hypothetical protein C8J43_102178 [Sphingomonas sp. PP-CE-1G-424]|nr:hypothetical protein C8J43_102178 [Sphingomonas sp. PP-CE-1G-424]
MAPSTFGGGSGWVTAPSDTFADEPHPSPPLKGREF